ncbi:glycerate kinase type-2 family protein [Candidatus Nitrospira allomarina]|uniref:Glycerate kinase n=1 Tax=Candidatus Nitrospira allomarina TaxID=3020900 RepID=A0AA96JSV6_9BACT|nr:glycerate kinase [Candidatus Nitrospira allomarina]WNM58500.1 glycerate kinase [Candidatus Nitrospira allomarina]
MSLSHLKKTRVIVQQANPAAKRILKSLIDAGLEACDPALAIANTLHLTKNRLQVHRLHYNLTRYGRIVCVGAGKASARMAVALEQMLGDRLEGGMVIVPDGHDAPCDKIRMYEAAHPRPDRRGVKATKQLLALTQSLSQQDLLIVLLSGGASSLLCAPSLGLTLAAKRRTTQLLLRSGATIHEINVVRKHMSAIKGGQLAQSTPATTLTLIMSDVLGDDLSTIGSGPTVTDPSTFQDAIDILQLYLIWRKVPESVQRHLQRARSKPIPAPLKATRQQALRNRHIVLANNRQALEGVAKTAKRLGLKPFILPYPLQGEAKEIGSILGGLARDLVEFGNPVHPPACLIAGGEPTVIVNGKGRGGRAQECVLAAARELAGLTNVFVAGFGTDGTDGPTDAAGAVVDGKTVQRAKKQGLSIEHALHEHDSYTFFQQIRGHIMTGPTGTNVNDIYLIVAM